MILVNKLLFESELIFSNSNLIFIKLRKNCESFIIGLAYSRPLNDDTRVLTDIENCLNFVLTNFNDFPISLVVILMRVLLI